MTKKHTITLSTGDKVAYWSYHDDRKPTIILVHGFTGSHEGFQYLVPLLKDFRLVAPDLPGFGVSPLPHDSMTLAHLGGHLVDFIDKLDLKEAPFLLGHSMGSLVVSEAVKQRPDVAANKLVLISPVPSPIKIADFRRAGALVSQLYYVASHRLPRVGKRLSTSKKITRFSTNLIMTAKDEKLRVAIHEHHFDNLNYISSIGWYSRLYKQINRTGITDYRKSLEKFDLLIINGDKDTVTPMRYQKLAANIVGAKLISIPGVGHLSHYEKPIELTTEIVRFLR